MNTKKNLEERKTRRDSMSAIHHNSMTADYDRFWAKNLKENLPPVGQLSLKGHKKLDAVLKFSPTVKIS